MTRCHVLCPGTLPHLNAPPQGRRGHGLRARRTELSPVVDYSVGIACICSQAAIRPEPHANTQRCSTTTVNIYFVDKHAQQSMILFILITELNLIENLPCKAAVRRAT